MARVEMTLTEPVIVADKSVGNVEVAPKTSLGDGVKLKNAFEAKDNSVYLVVANSAAAAKKVIIKAGNSYPNKVLGNKEVEVGASKTEVIMIQDQSRFENKDGSVDIDFQTGFTGSIFAIGKHAGIYKAAE